MPDQSIFDEDEQNKPEDKTIIPGEDDTTTTDQLLASIVNDDGEQKYKTAEEALKATAHAQTYIKQLEQENAEFKEKGTSTEKLDELLAAVNKSKDSGEGETTPALKPEDVQSIVEGYLTKTKETETKKDNIALVTKTFKDRYGKDASKELYGKADDLGFSSEEINSMIATNPIASLKILGVEVSKGQVVDPLANTQQIDSSGFQGKPDTAPKSVMGSSKTSDLDAAWAERKKRTYEKLGITEQ